MSFDNEALNWDTERRIKRAEILAQKILGRVEDKNKKQALEIGCGTGLISMNLKEDFNEIYCGDTSEGMLDILREKIKKYNVKNIKCVSNDILEDKTKYETFDVIYSSMVFHHIDDIKEELNKLYRLLKKDGQIIIVDLDEDKGLFHKGEPDFHGHNGFSRLEFISDLEQCGFKNSQIETAFNGKKKIGEDEVDYSLFISSGRK